MNWFDKALIKKHLFIMFNRDIVKTASLGPSLSTQLDWKSQAEDSLEFGNFQRYVCDSQTIKVFLTKTNDKYAATPWQK